MVSYDRRDCHGDRMMDEVGRMKFSEIAYWCIVLNEKSSTFRTWVNYKIVNELLVPGVTLIPRD